MLAFASTVPFIKKSSFTSTSTIPFSFSTRPTQQHLLSPLQRRNHNRNHNTSSSSITALFSNGRAAQKSILVFGGGSTLGTQVVQRFTAAAAWKVVTLDFYDASVECGGVNGCAIPDTSPSAPISLALPAGAPAATQVDIARKCLRSSCVDSFDVILNATLGFSPASLRDASLFDSCRYMYTTSVESSLVTASLAADFLKPGKDGAKLLVLVGSVAALPGTKSKSLLGFGAAKASVHQIVRLLSGTVGDDLPTGTKVLAVVPEVLDTPLHRSMNDGEPEQNWTPCDVVADKLFDWAGDMDKAPPNGALVSVSTSTSTTNETTDASNPVIPHTSHIFRIIQDSSFVQPTPL